jgi:hypothetical protein
MSRDASPHRSIDLAETAEQDDAELLTTEGYSIDSSAEDPSSSSNYEPDEDDVPKIREEDKEYSQPRSRLRPRLGRAIVVRLCRQCNASLTHMPVKAALDQKGLCLACCRGLPYDCDLCQRGIPVGLRQALSRTCGHRSCRSPYLPPQPVWDHVSDSE